MDFERLKASLAQRQPGIIGDVRPCAVLVPLVEDNGELCLLYEVRAQGLSLQPGEVCFPGGQMEAGESPVDCALRETAEELNLPAEAIEVLGELDYTIHAGGFPVFPVLARITGDWQTLLKRNPEEVEQVFTIPLSYLRYNKPRQARIERKYKLLDDLTQSAAALSDQRAKLETQVTLFWPYEGKILWGMSARITAWLLDWLQEHK